MKPLHKESYTWDIFLAHAGADLLTAEELYNLLQPLRVFLDSRCLLPGDNWDHELSRAQVKSLVTVVLVSSRTDEAYYQREEIAAAIQMAREKNSKHRVVPVFLQDRLTTNVEQPYGLRLKHGLQVLNKEELSGEYISKNYKIQQVTSLLGSDWWREPLNFYASIQGDITDLIDHTMKGLTYFSAC